jgi:hypothetical protein
MRGFWTRWLRGKGPWYALAFILTLFILWAPLYSITSTVAAGSISRQMTWHFYLGNSFQNSTQCSGPIRCTNASMTQSYGAGRLPHVGSLMQVIGTLWIVGIIALGVAWVVEILGAASKISPRPRRGWVPGVIALVALLTPLLLSVLFLPRDVNADRLAFPNSGSGPGPWISFAGSSQSSGVGLQWGPSVGWFLLLAAGAVLVLVLLWSWYDQRSDEPSEPSSKT